MNLGNVSRGLMYHSSECSVKFPKSFPTENWENKNCSKGLKALCASSSWILLEMQVLGPWPRHLPCLQPSSGQALLLGQRRPG